MLNHLFKISDSTKG